MSKRLLLSPMAEELAAQLRAKRLLETCGLGEEVSVTVRDKTLVIGPAPTRARTGWTEAIQNIPQEALDRDYEELQAFREMPEEWDAHG